MDFNQKIVEIIEELDALSIPERVEWSKKNYATSMVVKGVPVPNIRPIIKRLQDVFKTRPPGEVIAFSKQLNQQRILEGQQIAIEVLENHKSAIKSLTLDDMLDIGKGMDNWISVDYFAGLLAGPAWREGRITDAVVVSWAQSDDRWWRRAAVVCTVALNQKARGGNGDPDRTLMICEIVKTDQDEMVAKALSWALRELAKRTVEPVNNFVTQYENELPKRVRT